MAKHRSSGEITSSMTRQARSSIWANLLAASFLCVYLRLESLDDLDFRVPSSWLQWAPATPGAEVEYVLAVPNKVDGWLSSRASFEMGSRWNYRR
jgi:hypothetical protein